MIVLLADEQDDPLPHAHLIELAESVLLGEGLSEGTELSIVLADRDKITDFNGRFLGKKGATDVLAFPIEDLEPGFVAQPDPAGPPLTLGDVFICPAVVRENATESGVAFEDEMALMVVHGILHLLGYDHAVDTDAERMEARERDLLAAAGRTRP